MSDTGVLIVGSAAAATPAMWWIALTACGACLFATAVGCAPLLLNSNPDTLGLRFVLGGVIRTALTLGLALAMAKFTGWETRPLAAWFMGWYLLLLAVEVGLLIRHLARTPFTAKGGAA